MSQPLPSKQVRFFIVMGVLAYLTPFLMLASIVIPAGYDSMANQQDRFDYLWNYFVGCPLIAVCVIYILWIISTRRLTRKDKVLWCLIILTANFVGVICFYHHIQNIMKGKKYSPKIERLAETFLVRHHSDKSCLRQEQWYALLEHFKKIRNQKIALWLSPVVAGFYFFVSIYGYKILAAMNETPLLAFPILDATLWGTLEPARKWQAICCDFAMVSTVGLFFGFGLFFLSISLRDYFFESKTQINTLSMFIPLSKPG